MQNVWSIFVCYAIMFTVLQEVIEFTDIKIDNSSLRNGSFQENKFKNIKFRQTDLTQVQFFKTSLIGVKIKE